MGFISQFTTRGPHVAGFFHGSWPQSQAAAKVDRTSPSLISNVEVEPGLNSWNRPMVKKQYVIM